MLTLSVFATIALSLPLMVAYIDHYYDKKDDANINKYINTGLKLFPKDDYLPLLALDYARDKGDAAGISRGGAEVPRAAARRPARRTF
mgnify:CR=1 FL=1